jgi:hypothetical protein
MARRAENAGTGGAGMVEGSAVAGVAVGVAVGGAVGVSNGGPDGEASGRLCVEPAPEQEARSNAPASAAPVRAGPSYRLIPRP